jgi:hypothetical protein
MARRPTTVAVSAASRHNIRKAQVSRIRYKQPRKARVSRPVGRRRV